MPHDVGLTHFFLNVLRCWLRRCNSSLPTRSTPTKFVLLSLYTCPTWRFWPTNGDKVLINEPVDNECDFFLHRTVIHFSKNESISLDHTSVSLRKWSEVIDVRKAVCLSVERQCSHELLASCCASRKSNTFGHRVATLIIQNLSNEWQSMHHFRITPFWCCSMTMGFQSLSQRVISE